MQQAFVTVNTARDAPGSCVLVRKPRHVGALHDVMYGSAWGRTRAIVTGPYGAPQALPDGRPIRGDSAHLPPGDLIRRGGRAQIVSDQDFARTRPDDLTACQMAGENVRVVEGKLSHKLIVIDDNLALVALGPYGSPCLFVRDAGVVGAFAALFDAYWAQGSPWTPGATSPPPQATTARERVLECLAAGLKDEAIARRLGMSVRTIRRHVSALMHELGASTRFAAGVAVVRQGMVGGAS